MFQLHLASLCTFFYLIMRLFQIVHQKSLFNVVLQCFQLGLSQFFILVPCSIWVFCSSAGGNTFSAVFLRCFLFVSTVRCANHKRMWLLMLVQDHSWLPCLSSSHPDLLSCSYVCQLFRLSVKIEYLFLLLFSKLFVNLSWSLWSKQRSGCWQFSFQLPAHKQLCWGQIYTFQRCVAILQQWNVLKRVSLITLWFHSRFFIVCTVLFSPVVEEVSPYFLPWSVWYWVWE